MERNRRRERRGRVAKISWWLFIAAACVPRAATAQIDPTVSAAATLPAPWVAQDVGNPALSGTSVPDADGFAITGSGEDIAAVSDQFRFVYQILAGNVQVKARVDSLASIPGFSKAGLMIRSSLEPDAAHASVLISAGGELAVHRRDQARAWTMTSSGNTMSRGPQWLALQRIGSRVLAFSSADGKTWTAIGNEVIELAATVYVGIAVAAADGTQRTVADISQVSVSGLPPWQRQDNIGAPAVRGSAWLTQDTYTITGGGAIGDAHDQFNFVYQAMRGDGELVARVASLSSANPSAKAGVMIRDSLGGESPHAFVSVSAGNGYAFDRRDHAGAWSEHTDGGSGTAPGWVRLVRSGNTIEAYRSSDGLTWISMGSSQLVMNEQVYAGLAVTSQGSRTIATAEIDAVRITPTEETPSQPPAASSPAVQDTETVTTTISLECVDDLLGIPNLPPLVALTSPTPGTTYTAPATMTISATASDPEGRLAGVRFYANNILLGSVSAPPYSFRWSPVPAGSFLLMAVAADADGAATASPPVSITVNPAPNQPPSVTLMAPPSGATYTAPASITLTATASDPENRLARVEFYQGNTLLTTDTVAPYSFVWSNVPAGSYTLRAVAADADGATTTSSTVSVTVQPNQPPSVTLTAPPSGATYTAPASISLTATASDPENRLERVEFYQGSTLLASDTSAPYAFTWSSVPAGSYTLTAVAIDAEGAKTMSAGVNITVAPPPNQPPSVTLTAPPSGATYTAPASITLTAAASDPENRLARVEFYQGSTPLANDTSAPFTFTWSSVPVGSYSLTAVASDVDGASTMSPAVSITVTGSSWRVMFTASDDHDTNVGSYLLEVFASGVDPNTGPAIEWTNLGKPVPNDDREISVDETAFFSSLSPGNYTATVSAIGPGGSARSSAVAFAVG